MQLELEIEKEKREKEKEAEAEAAVAMKVDSVAHNGNGNEEQAVPGSSEVNDSGAAGGEAAGTPVRADGDAKMDG